ncbi:hypothetical protein pEaSNUABM37_00012 [Erwinia phage pEa_SNUABM_37]|nr:hypothetical protein pEaSNUABM37_00012 [Erwinia phage pEa_SNUABM_37]QXO10482.1 hypothetical protein pEaSNUABM48_00012 [Erwinia phage pEa_SNUABM_48]
MNIFDKARDSLLFDLIEEHNNIKLNRTYAILTNWTNGTGVNGVDATVDVESNDPAFYYNFKRINYGKLDLNNEFKLLNPTLKFTEADTSHTLLNLINQKYGLVLTTDDIQLTQVDSSATPWQIYIRAKPTSPIAKTNTQGVLFKLDTTNNHLSVPLKKLVLTGLVPPSTDLARLQGPLMTYPAFTANSTPVANYAVGYVMTAPSQNDWAVADILSTTTGEQWGFTHSNYTLYGAKVLFNGLTSLALTNGYHVNTDHTYVLILQCGSVGKVGGYVVVHY